MIGCPSEKVYVYSQSVSMIYARHKVNRLRRISTCQTGVNESANRLEMDAHLSDSFEPKICFTKVEGGVSITGHEEI